MFRTLSGDFPSPVSAFMNAPLEGIHMEISCGFMVMREVLRLVADGQLL